MVMVMVVAMVAMTMHMHMTAHAATGFAVVAGVILRFVMELAWCTRCVSLEGVEAAGRGRRGSRGRRGRRGFRGHRGCRGDPVVAVVAVPRGLPCLAPQNEKGPDECCRRAWLFSTLFNVAASGGKSPRTSSFFPSVAPGGGGCQGGCAGRGRRWPAGVRGVAGDGPCQRGPPFARWHGASQPVRRTVPSRLRRAGDGGVSLPRGDRGCQRAERPPPLAQCDIRSSARRPPPPGPGGTPRAEDPLSCAPGGGSTRVGEWPQRVSRNSRPQADSGGRKNSPRMLGP